MCSVAVSSGVPDSRTLISVKTLSLSWSSVQSWLACDLAMFRLVSIGNLSYMMVTSRVLYDSSGVPSALRPQM